MGSGNMVLLPILGILLPETILIVPSLLYYNWWTLCTYYTIKYTAICSNSLQKISKKEQKRIYFWIQKANLICFAWFCCHCHHTSLKSLSFSGIIHILPVGKVVC
jgi:hypothetical protein